MPPAESRLFTPKALLAAGVLVTMLAVVWIATLPADVAYGWDESMHVALPAAEMRIALSQGEFGRAFEALLGCGQYPFVQPVLLAFVQSVCGASAAVARAFGIVEWCATILGVFVLTRLVIDSIGPARRASAAWLAPWIAFVLAALSPLALEFAGTLFLEIPSACAGVWTIVAWLAFWKTPSRRRALLTGALVSVALFTKWNYGLLLAAGLVLDLVLRLVATETRSERLRHVPALALIPVAALLWWFVLPLPGGFGVAAEHRSALAGFLTGNREMTPTPMTVRLFFASCLLAAPPRMFAVICVGVIAAALAWRHTAVRAMFVLFPATWLPVWLHPFFLERFLVPGAVCLWVLAAIGLARILPSRPAAAVATVFALLGFTWLPLQVQQGLSLDTWKMLDALGIGAATAEARSYQARILAPRQSLFVQRGLTNGGLARAEAEALIAAVAREVGPDDRIGWIGTSSEMSPATLHIGLLEHGGSRERFLRDAGVQSDLDYFADPGADAAAVKRFAEDFDVIFATNPPDLKGRKQRNWAAGARELLVADGTWTAREIGRVPIARPAQDPLVVTLFACRRSK